MRYRCATTPTPSPSACPSVATSTRNKQCDGDAVVGVGAAERGDDPRHEVDTDRQAERDAGPREQAGDEPEPPPAEARADQCGEDGDVERVHRRSSAVADEQPGVGEEPGVRDHAVIRPDRLAFDVPRALEHLE